MLYSFPLFKKQSASNAFQYVVARRLKYRSAMQGQRYGEFLGIAKKVFGKM